MTKNFKIFFLSLLLILSGIASRLYSQNSTAGDELSRTLDSLNLVVKTAKHDTTRLSALLNIGDVERNYRLGYWDTLRLECQKSIDNNKNENNLVKNVYTKILAGALSNLAYIHQNKGNIETALQFDEHSLRLRESIGDKYGQANSLHNIAYIYQNQGLHDKALEYYSRILKISEEINNLTVMASALTSIGHIHSALKQFSVAIQYFEKSLKISIGSGDKKNMADTYYFIGAVHQKEGNLNNALSNYSLSIQMNRENGDRGAVASTLAHITAVYLLKKDNAAALEYAKQSMKISEEVGYPVLIRNSSSVLTRTYKAIGNYQLALENYELYIKMRDSINNVATRKASIKNQLKYEYEKQAAADSVAHAKESEIKNVELQRQSAEIKARKNQQHALFGGLGLVIIFAGFMYNRFKITQKQKGIIESQKAEVEKQKNMVDEKQKEVLDSIHYAKRIQTAHLPSEKKIINSLERLRTKNT